MTASEQSFDLPDNRARGPKDTPTMIPVCRKILESIASPERSRHARCRQLALPAQTPAIRENMTGIPRLFALTVALAATLGVITIWALRRPALKSAARGCGPVPAGCLRHLVASSASPIAEGPSAAPPAAGLSEGSRPIQSWLQGWVKALINLWQRSGQRANWRFQGRNNGGTLQPCRGSM
jgi:hypothetical protein